MHAWGPRRALHRDLASVIVTGYADGCTWCTIPAIGVLHASCEQVTSSTRNGEHSFRRSQPWQSSIRARTYHTAELPRTWHAWGASIRKHSADCHWHWTPRHPSMGCATHTHTCMVGPYAAFMAGSESSTMALDPMQILDRSLVARIGTSRTEQSPVVLLPPAACEAPGQAGGRARGCGSGAAQRPQPGLPAAHCNGSWVHPAARRGKCNTCSHTATGANGRAAEGSLGRPGSCCSTLAGPSPATGPKPARP